MHKSKTKEICKKFCFEGTFVSAEPYGDGHINDTYKVTYDSDGGEEVLYILQRVNGTIFREPKKLMENITNVTAYLNDIIVYEETSDDYEVLQIVKTLEGEAYHIDNDGALFRAYVFVLNATGHTFAEDTRMLEAAGRAFGEMQRLLENFPVNLLHETIKDFHNTLKRYETFKFVCQVNPMGRVVDCEDQISFIDDRQEVLGLIINALEESEIPIRVTHNDTKINNVLLDDETLQGRCVIDLDTVMPGSALYDYGDAIRSCGSTEEEDSEDLDNLDLDLERFEAYTKGYLLAVGSTLTDKEIQLLPYGALIMTLECGMRFLTDHLDGDKYFKVHKENHNLTRCKNQFAYVEAMESKMDQMKAIIEKYKS